MDPKEFLKLADHLKDRPDEASHRSSVSRAYYAVFNCFYNVFSDMGFKLSQSSQAHEEIIRMARNCGLEELEIHAYDRDNFRKQRNNADYLSRKKVFTRIEAKMWRQNAKKMIVQIEQKSTDANERERLVNGIKKYQEKLNPESQ